MEATKSGFRPKWSMVKMQKTYDGISEKYPVTKNVLLSTFLSYLLTDETNEEVVDKNVVTEITSNFSFKILGEFYLHIFTLCWRILNL